MPDWFSQKDILRIIEAARTRKLLTGEQRNLLFWRIEDIQDRLQTSSIPDTQIRLDLMVLNQDARRKDGRLALRIWLENAIQLSAGTPTEDIFQEYLDRLEPDTPAGPPLPDPEGIPEYKEAIVHQDDMVPYLYLKAGFDAGHSVARIHIPRFDSGKSGKKKYWGTGWVLSKDLLITNHHVFNARNAGEDPASTDDFKLQALASTVQFDVDDESASPSTLEVTEVIASDAKLDACIVRLSADAPYPPLPIAPDGLTLSKNDYVPLNIIQHPYGQAKRVAIRNNLAAKITGDEVHYFTDTLSGSSGSPVFNDDWQVVALHRGSRAAKVNYQGRPTAVLNIGTLIYSILKWVKTASPATHQAIKSANE